MPDGQLFVLPEEGPEPTDAVPPDDVIGVDDLGEVSPRGDVTTDDNGRSRPFTADDRAHRLDFFDIGPDGADPHDVVGGPAQLVGERLERRKVQDRAGGVDIGLQHQKAEGAVKHTQREPSLQAGDLVVIQLHGVDAAAPELVVPGERSEDAAQKYPGLDSLRVKGDCGIAH